MIPDYQTLMEPVLRCAADQEVKTGDIIESLAGAFNLTLDERAEQIPSGGQAVFYNRIHWAKTYLKQAGLIEYTRRGHFHATERGRAVLQDPKVTINNRFLRTMPEFVAFQSRGKAEEQAPIIEAALIDATPEEALRDAYLRINNTIAADLLERLRAGTPAFFERSIVQLLLAMGYGGSSEDAGRAIGQSGDDGVDGVIDQDPLGVDQIYIQAKRYAEGNAVGSPAIRDFYGSLSLKKAQKGIFVTTSGFSKSAVETARQIGARIVLIDSEQLGKLMVRHNVGCRDQEILHIKRIDEDFFE
ncbi:MAG: restriction endonuclease [Novosphingobium sp.]